MDHSICWTIIGALVVAVKSLAFAYWKKDRAYTRVVEKAIEREQEITDIFQGLNDTRHGGV